MKRTILSKFAPIVLCSFLCSLLCACEEKQNPETLLVDMMKEVNKKGNGYDKFTIYNTNSYYAILYQLENTPENNAKILWLGNHDELADKFRTEMLKNLKPGNILARVVKEKKSLVLSVTTKDIEYRAVIKPEEIVEKIFKK